ncbi:MAG: DsbA family protein [Dongiaceae bacterium]
MRFLSLIVLSFALIACGQEQVGDQAALSPSQTEQVKALIRDTLKQDPQIVVDSLEAYREKQRADASQKQEATLKEQKDKILNNAEDPVYGNPNGDITVVEFFDYNCPYCKQVWHPLKDTVDQDGQVRLVFKEFPILGDSSTLAAKAALAAHSQGKYAAMHEALMDYKQPKDEAAIRQLATSAGLNADQLFKDMESPKIADHIAATRQLAIALNISGTPAFIVGESFYPGALTMGELKDFIAKERAKKAAAVEPSSAPIPPAAQQ